MNPAPNPLTATKRLLPAITIKIVSMDLTFLSLSASNDNMLKEFKNQLKDITEIIFSSPELEEVLSKPVLSVEKRRRLLEGIINKIGCHKSVSNLLLVMLANYRLNYIKIITGIVEEEIDRREGVLRGEFITANPVDSFVIHRAEDELSKILGKKIIFNSIVNKEIIGGAVIRIGSVEIDGSVLRRINTIENINII